MKYILFIVSVSLMLSSSLCLAQSNIKEKKITLSFENRALGDVFQQIEKEHNLSFAYGSGIREQKVSGSYQNEPLDSFLTKLLSKIGLEHKYVGDQITIFIKKNINTPRQNIKGEVYDQHLKTPLPGATIKLLGNNTGTVTSVDGTFLLKDLPIGRYDLEISFVGYLSRMMENVELGAGKEVILEIGMVEDVNQLGEIVISGYENKVVPINQMAVVSARSISSEEAQRFAGSLSDPARMALSYAGVNSSNGYTNEIIVRGNSPKGLLWKLEGIEIPNPNHYAVEGSSGGFINILNSNNMSRSDFFLSAFPAEYGNATSGIFDLRMRKGNTDEREHTVEVASLGLRASTEGPLGKNNGSYLVNYRYSTLGLLNSFMTDIDFPVFQDATFKLHLPTKKMGTFSVFGLGGLGKWDEESSVGYIDTVQNKGVEKTWHDVQHYNLGIVGVTHAMPLKNNKTYLENVVAISATQNLPSSSSFNYEMMEPYLEEKGEYVNTAYRLSSTINHKVSVNHLLTGGIKLNFLRYKLESEEGLPNGTITKGLEKDGNAALLQSFFNWQFRPSELWIVNGGLHLTYFSLSEQTVTEPRIGIERKLGAHHSLSLSAGLHSRHESIATYFGEYTKNGQIIRPNENLQLSKAAHVVLGYNATLAEDFHLKAEAYWQHLYDIPVENDPISSYSSINHDVSFTTKDLVNEGIGRNYGVELTLEKNFSKHYYFLVTGSLFNSEYKALDDIWRDTRYNTNYAVNILGGKEYVLETGEKYKAIGVNLRGALSGGKRVTPIDLEKSIEAGQEVQIPELAYTHKLSDYYRLDFSVYYKWERKHTSHQIKVDILNLLEQNIYGIRYVPSKFDQPAFVKEYAFNEDDDEQSNLFPVIGYTINF